MTENSKKNIMNNFVAPLFQNLGTGANSEKVLNDFQKETGSKDYDILMEFVYTGEQLLRCMKNHEDLNKKTYLSMNMVVPHRWEQRCKMYALRCMMRQIKLENSKKEEFDRLSKKFEKLVKENPEIYSYYEKKNKEYLDDMVSNPERNLLSNTDDLTDTSIKRLTELILITDSNIKFYHGTSYKNYLKILEDGFIRATDYSDAKYPNSKIEKLYNSETGYIFVMDSLDVPLSFCFGGFRKNAIPWAYDSGNRKDISDEVNEDYEDDLDTIGVVFEIDPTKYELYFRVKESEFNIKGDISIDDMNVLFFRQDKKTGHIIQVSEDDLRRDGII